MTKRFFKLVYVIALIAIVLSIPIGIFTSIQFDRVVVSSYKVKCLTNNQYVVLQGAPVGDAVVMDDLYLNSENQTAIKEQMNFYCKYYNDIQPHIVAYNNANTILEQVEANKRFVEFENEMPKIYAYPELYKLEVVKNQTNLREIYYPVIEWLMLGLMLFIVLQIIRISYVYVVYGKIIWHPFKKMD